MDMSKIIPHMASTQHTVDLFLKLSSFTRYLLDEVLSAEVYNNKQGFRSDTLENLIEECDALDISIRTFRNMTKILQVSETASKINQTIKTDVTESLKLDTQHILKFTELCELIKKKINSIQDVAKIKPYYCKICNLATCYEYAFNQHCSSKKHVEQMNQTKEPLAIHKCKLCHLILMAPQSEIISITSLSEHNLLDDHMQNLKGFNNEIQTKNVGGPSKLFPDQINHRDIQEFSTSTPKGIKSENDLIPEKVNQLFQIMKENVKAESQLAEMVPHYCNVCDVMAYSVSKFIEHSSSKEHIAATNNATKPINVVKCEKCGFLITGFQTVIDGIINSISHLDLDDFVKSLKDYNSFGKAKNKGVSSSSNLETMPYQEDTIKVMSDQIIIPDLLKQSIISLIEKLILPSDLKKFTPSYCFVCDKVFLLVHDFKQHVNSRKHNLNVSTAAKSFCVHSCSTCFISLYGTNTDIRNVLNSVEHNKLHQKIQYLSLRSSSTEVFNDPDKNKSNKNKQKEILKNDNFTLLAVEISPSSVDAARKPQLVSTSVTDCEENTRFRQIDSSNGAQLLDKPSHRVPEKFLNINSKLHCGNFLKSGFCRPCQKAINITNGWNTHLSSSKHRKAVERLQFENIPKHCNYCPLQILGDPFNVCMELHTKFNHSILNASVNESKKDIPLIKEDTNDNRSDISSNTPSHHSESPDNTESSCAKKDCFESEEKSNIVKDVKSIILNFVHSTDQLDEESARSVDKSVDNCKQAFIEFLEKRKSLFLNEGLKQFGGMCLLCAQTYEDYFDWLVHLKSEIPKNLLRTDIVEKACVKCNLSLFGKKTEIENEFINLKEHISLDDLFAQ